MIKKIVKLLGALVVAGAALFSCSNDITDNSQKIMQAYLLTQKQNVVEYGSIVMNNSESRAIDLSELTSVNVIVAGYGFSDISVDNVSIVDGRGNGQIDKIPVGNNRVVKVQSNVTGAVLYAVTEIKPGLNNVSVNWSTSALGHVYWELLKTQNKDISSISADEIEVVLPDVHAALVNAEEIAKDYPNFKTADKYVLDYGTVSLVSSGVDGLKVRVTDLASAVVEGNATESLKCYPGEWKVQILDAAGSVVKAETVNVFAGYETKVTVTKTEAVTGKIIVHVPASLNYTNCHHWNGDKSEETTWPGDSLNKNGDFYDIELPDTKTKIIFNGSGKQTKDLYITEGEWEYTGGAFGTEDSSGANIAKNFKALSGDGEIKITVVEPELPEIASYTMTSKSAVGGKINISVTSNCDLTSAIVTIGGVTKELSIGDNIFEVSDFTSVARNLSVSGSIKNEAGTVNISGTIQITEKPLLVSDWNELRIYQVMVASFQDGDPSRGYTQMWGPDNQLKGGDLQGVINAIPYIKDLGCNAIWMTPIFNSNGDSKLDATGYFAYDYFNIDPKFGTMETFDKLVEECHNNGIAVILDGVFGHNKGSVAASPNRSGIKNPGISPSTSNPVNYSNNENSLKYYSDVARYWITEHKIDGWRFDQCYQLGFGENAKGTAGDNCDGCDRNHWYDIRKVIEEAAASNGTAGQDWGTLGYIVGEHWRGDASTIQKGSVNGGSAPGYGLNGCFDFPAYYQLIQGFAAEYNGKSTGNIGAALAYTYKTYSEKGYVCKDDDGKYDTYYPNLMLTNHDLFRVGDLINRKFSDGFESDTYAKRNMILLAAQAAYTGPITIYYGDEIGDHSATTTSGWGDDNVARSSGKITGFNTREQKIHDFEKKVLTVRAEHKALWGGSNTEITNTADFYVSKKQADGETIFIAFNYSSSSKTFSASGTDLLTGTEYSGTVSVPALSAVFVLAK